MISAVVLTKDSQQTLKRCLKSLLWCDEVIIIDDYSKDKTVSIAKKLNAKVFIRGLNNDFSAQRNFGLSKAKGDWVLFLDSDEEIAKPITPEAQHSGYFLKRKDFWLGCELKYGETNIRLLRFAKKNSGKWKRRVHEYWDIKGKIWIADARIIHHPHPTLREFFSEIGSYSFLHFLQNKKEGKGASILKVVFFPVLKFIYGYVFKRGFEDGVHGFVIAGIMGFHSFLSWSGLWLSSRKKKYQTY